MKLWPLGARSLRAALLLSTAAVAVAQQGARAPLSITGITPAGTNVPAGRQLVIQFNRPVVPIGRMDRSAAEIPVEIAPALACQWRWLDTSALACQLADGAELELATRYTVVVREGITAEDGATTSGTLRHEFTTERPRVSYAPFATWRSPGTPVIRAVFTQPVSESSVREHLYLRPGGGARLGVEVEPDAEFGEPPQSVGGEAARRIWLVQPRTELPLDTRVERLRVEFLVPADRATEQWFRDGTAGVAEAAR